MRKKSSTLLTPLMICVCGFNAPQETQTQIRRDDDDASSLRKIYYLKRESDSIFSQGLLSAALRNLKVIWCNFSDNFLHILQLSAGWLYFLHLNRE